MKKLLLLLIAAVTFTATQAQSTYAKVSLSAGDSVYMRMSIVGNDFYIQGDAAHFEPDVAGKGFTPAASGKVKTNTGILISESVFTDQPVVMHKDQVFIVDTAKYITDAQGRRYYLAFRPIGR